MTILKSIMLVYSVCYCLIIFIIITNCQNPLVTYKSLMDTSYNLDSVLEHLAVPRPFSGNKDICYQGEFHPDNLRARIENVHSVEDCIVICRDSNDCSATAYFRRLKKCFIASPFKERIMTPNLPESFVFMKDFDTEYCIPVDINRYKMTHPIMLDSGGSLGTCGRPYFYFRIKRQKRIINGGEASFYSLPWMVSLRSLSDDHFCGGSLIAPDNNLDTSRFILTAAHCIVKTFSLTGGLELAHLSIDAIIGSHDLRFTQAHEKRIVIKKAILHPLCKDMSSLYLWNILNDVAILVLETPINFNHYIQPICLPIPDIEQNDKNVSKCFVAGWGVTMNEEDLPNDKLKAALYTILRDEEVNLIAIGGQPPNYGRIATYDSGGPLFCESSFQTYTMYGVVNSGMNVPNMHGDYEDTFANIFYYTTWIHYVMQNYQQITRNTGIVYEFEDLDFDKIVNF